MASIEPQPKYAKRTEGTARRPVLWLWVLGSLLVLLGICLWIGCSVTEKNYDMLRFFFDGVPPPLDEAMLLAGGVVVGDRVEFVHSPYAAEQCSACHQTAEQLLISRDEAEICLQCHREVPSRHRYTHGAVAGMACLWCHEPHSSPLLHLLREPAPSLCMKCHTPRTINVEIVGHRDLTRDCLECHYGHGGEGRFFLKPFEDPVAREHTNASDS